MTKWIRIDEIYKSLNKGEWKSALDIKLEVIRNMEIANEMEMPGINKIYYHLNNLLEKGYAERRVTEINGNGMKMRTLEYRLTDAGLGVRERYTSKRDD